MRGCFFVLRAVKIEAMRPEPPEGGAKFRILIVEDDLNIGRLMVLNLQRAGFECHHAVDGQDGLTQFRTKDPHLVLLDVMMPRMSGRELCLKLRETSTIPIIMMTALDSEEDHVEGFKLGADDYVPKPFNPKLLVARVVSWMRRVYRYDVPPELEDKTPVSSGIPAGWATCEACGYMGPRQKYENRKADGNIALTCPYCKQTEFIAFAIS